ncbi:uncharacterized protein LOC103505177 isoform X2 [Diaphorina citri]|uniref:Uncharacterized protein LOC103505177 isoform X2 n=1 Tax=Diaphorina citri TaxID=121845 RepID=A0A1S3CTX6_DIACI|nr:uncharacterized protein LOC103505177 isoform X2 [Diaphorina citri]KAI5698270.1 hypothetical protein M8J75_004399 [Diaphorina citri]KAI5724048.1 hypothetical protein M8J76_014783 [Diaphorina citri]KAI5728477.1 hypothetical protein M8J77_016759 [Diaphorina citri]
MKSEKLVFDVLKMVLTSAVYLALAVSGWIFLRLVYTCFVFPKVMRNLERGLSKKIDQMKKNQERRPSTDEMAVVEEETAEDNELNSPHNPWNL